MRLKVWQKWVLGAGCGCTSLLVALALALYIPFALNMLTVPPRPANLPPVVTLPVIAATDIAPLPPQEPVAEPNPTPTEDKTFALNPFPGLTAVELSPYPYITGVGPRAKEIFALGQRLGNRANVFSKVGDSISFTAAYLTPFGKGQYDLGAYA
ncbi:MAG: hypothetical protein HUU38_30555, partial [Anaerolineales bacterium]|nr:hypothetical protein [Anaerolineales bacterium]